jgi:hypothetical protein
MSNGDVFERAAAVRNKLRTKVEGERESNAVNAISVPAPAVEEQTAYAVNAVNAVSQGEEAVVEPRRRRAPPSELPDPGARCLVHKRFLTFAEQLHGGCSWCEWQERGQ